MADCRARLNRLEEAIAPTRRVRYVFVERGQPRQEALDATTGAYVAEGRLTPAEVEAIEWICVRWMEPGAELKAEDNPGA